MPSFKSETLSVSHPLHLVAAARMVRMISLVPEKVRQPHFRFNRLAQCESGLQAQWLMERDGKSYLISVWAQYDTSKLDVRAESALWSVGDCEADGAFTLYSTALKLFDALANVINAN